MKREPAEDAATELGRRAKTELDMPTAFDAASPRLQPVPDARRHTVAGSGPTRLEWATMEFKRITVDVRQMSGVPCLRGLRIPVATILSLVAEGQPVERILALYPDLEADDVREALLFAAEAVRERTLPLAAGQ